LCLFSFDLAEMVFLRIWISARRAFAWGVGFVCLCPGGCVGVAEGGWRDCVFVPPVKRFNTESPSYKTRSVLLEH